MIQIKGLTKTYGLMPRLVQQIQLAVIQSTALYRAELWWKSPKNHENIFKPLLKRQARSITGMYPSTPVHPLLYDISLAPASIVLDGR